MAKTRAPWLTKLLVTIYDSVLGMLCMYSVMRIRYIYEEKPVPEHIDIWASLLFGLACLVVWSLTRANKAVWRFTSFDDVRALLGAVTLASLLTPVVLLLFFSRAEGFPRSAPFLTGALFFLMLIASRAAVLFYHNGDIRTLFSPVDEDKPPAILIGRSQVLHDYMRDKAQNKHEETYRIRGLIETGGGHKGRSIRGVPVIGNLSDVRGVVANIEDIHGAKPTLILVDTSTDRKKASELVKLASTMGASLVRIRPGRQDALTPFEAADLIGRSAKALDMTPVQRMIANKRILITGAGGTIGSELARQIAAFGPAHMILVDGSEMNLYTIDQILSEYEDLSYTAYLGDVRDEVHMDEIFDNEKPQVILHAAALKHVPLMEANPIEAILTNVGGTKTIIKMAMKYKAESFTLISTDKAVEPNNIMGASKRIAEMLTMATAMNEADISASAVRFGNVLASNGSVVPLFERQIENGGPVTVTHKDATRFFMTTGEAASLVLQAAALNGGQRKEVSAIYVLDMGEPVNITRLARQLIRLRGFVPGRDIKIKFTGLRPGEKLTESLTGEEESLETTYVKGIYRFTGQVNDPSSVGRRVEKLLAASQKRDRVGVKKALAGLVPEFEPNGGLS
ncbi:MAG: polysaccharide biosynthesis protein [Robiginitomaculum sp.]|nr:MAG: polysaccharide biosynthesis protein [Robiginitomaculum sp.]